MKWYKAIIEKKQVSTDAGSTWTDVTPLETRHGRVIGEFDTYDDCMNVIYRWVDTGEFECNYVFDENSKIAFTFNIGNGKFLVIGKDYNNDSTDTYLTSAETSSFRTIQNYYHSCPIAKIELGSRVTGIQTIALDSFGDTNLVMHGSGIGLGQFALRHTSSNIDFGNITSMSSGSCLGMNHDVIIPDNSQLTAIPPRCFQGGNLKHVVIGDSITEIGQSAFTDCTELLTVEIGYNVTQIRTNAFYNSPKMEYFIVHPLTPPFITGNYTLFSTNNCPIYVHAAAYYSYKNGGSTWGSFSDRLRPF